MRNKQVVNENENDYINLEIVNSPKQNPVFEDDLYEYVEEPDSCKSEAEKASEKNDEKIPTGEKKLTCARFVTKWKVGTVISTTAAIGFIVAFAVVLYRQNMSATPCDRTECNNNGTCAVLNQQPVCLCPYGYQGKQCNETPCDEIVCNNNGTCAMVNLQPVCLCRYGYQGTHCQESTCENHICQNGGACIDKDEKPLCLCKPGFLGDSCQNTLCDEIVCNNNGTCAMINQQPTCLCPYGYQGTRCQESTCMNHVCQNGGMCIDKDKEPLCLCKYGFYGERCQYTYESCVEDDSDQTICLELKQDTTDDYDWAIRSGLTPSVNTGPASAMCGCYYYYFETSDPVNTGEKTRLFFNVTGSYRCLRFWYHMYGANMGSLSILFNQSRVWSIGGDQNNTWHPAQLNLPSSSFTKVIFEAVRGSDFTSDIAIDGVRVTRSQC